MRLIRLAAASLVFGALAFAQKPAFKVLAFYSAKVEPDHIRFANDALSFFGAEARKNNFVFEATTDWTKLNAGNLKNYQVVAWINDFPHSAAEKRAFEQYMEHGGGWLGFHVAAYNDETTQWPWLVAFLGGGVFDANNWPPLPARLTVDNRTHPVTQHLPESFTSPSNEWYRWEPSPRLNRDVQVLVTLDPSNYPLGKKDILTAGDLPVVWTNTKYRMLYMNMGHGGQIFTEDSQNRMMVDAILWLGGRK